MTKAMIAGRIRDVVWSERRDDGGMFDADVGVFIDDDGRHVPYVKSGWGAGIKGGPLGTLQEAKDDIPRLWGRMYGEET